MQEQEMAQQKKYIHSLEENGKCPSPDDGLIAVILYRVEQIEGNLKQINDKIESILPKMHQMSGAWGFAKMVGSFILGAAAVGGFILSYLRP